MSGMRVGQGFDVHAFGPGDHLILGGVRIPFDHGFVAHSDGDVLLHAICDALFGAAGQGDIGRHFPDTDERFRGANSRDLLRETLRRVQEAGWRPVNVDATVIAQAPKMAPHVAAMEDHIAADLGLMAGAVNVKATTTERLGFTGRGEGVAAQAVVLLEPSSGLMHV
ncbi:MULTISPECIES: 2-C-methyl-D-erythritol 2,4-cyclodiphosphate synthase [unclassified Thioalkalivibrio]|uniref:2-C-methyl-D-erythritol 2,4-cyclodiphosphate synthase n=1 Tax=unclassified Thioalkalivibrio TaxID=2621013 RepID=UPI00037EBFF2|nr:MULTISPECIES: 2-C-methyl-D-erythritol 2,4-cyclodiphosphate synthase [unclassified Thioalkalivibrio]